MKYHLEVQEKHKEELRLAYIEGKVDALKQSLSGSEEIREHLKAIRAGLGPVENSGKSEVSASPEPLTPASTNEEFKEQDLAAIHEEWRKIEEEERKKEIRNLTTLLAEDRERRERRNNLTSILAEA